jgi:hypothetical protein
VGLNVIESLLTTRLPFTLPSLVHRYKHIRRSSVSLSCYRRSSIGIALCKKFRAGSCFGVLESSWSFLAENSECSFLNLVCKSIEVFLISLIVIVLDSARGDSVGEIIVLRAYKCGVKLPLAPLDGEVVAKSAGFSSRDSDGKTGAEKLWMSRGSVLVSSSTFTVG